VRLFRPWSAEHLLAALPATVKRITVMDRTKEHGSGGEARPHRTRTHTPAHARAPARTSKNANAKRSSGLGGTCAANLRQLNQQRGRLHRGLLAHA
jgi:pyruvate/2-oxoacid:ferredoxin oxidoreductase alpha subunit